MLANKNTLFSLAWALAALSLASFGTPAFADFVATPGQTYYSSGQGVTLADSSSSSFTSMFDPNGSTTVQGDRGNGIDRGRYGRGAKHRMSPSQSHGRSELENWFSETKADPDSQGVSSCQAELTSPNPVIISSGVKVKSEIDFESEGEMPLTLVRNYSSANSGNPRNIFGYAWASTFDYSLTFYATNGGNNGLPICAGGRNMANDCATKLSSVVNPDITIKFASPSGSRFTYKWQAAASRWEEAKSSALAWIERLPNNTWRRHASDGSEEIYDVNGNIMTVTNVNGIQWTYTYSANAFLNKITHSSGRYVQFTWSSAANVASIIDPAGATWLYSVTPITSFSSALTTVVSPAPAIIRTYHYENSALARWWQLTGISVNGQRYSTYSYSADKAVSSELAGGMEKLTFAYGTDAAGRSTTTVTNTLGAVTKYTYENVVMASGTQKQIAKIDRSGVTNCPNATAETYYDSNGYVAYEIAWNGTRTNSTYSSAGLLLEKTYGITPSTSLGTRKEIFTWDSVYLRPTSETTYENKSGWSPVRQTTYTYTAPSSSSPNRLASVTTTNLSSRGVYGQSQTTSYTYSVWPNKILSQVVEDGPAAGSADTTTAAFSITGDLISTTNALGQSVQRGGYNARGQIGYITDPNGNTISFQYNGSGQMTSSSEVVNGASRATTYAYAPLGYVSKITYSDGQVENKLYSAAGYLTEENHSITGSITDRLLYSYNTVGTLTTKKIVRTTSGVDQLQYQETYGTDEIGRITTSSGNNGQLVTFTYDNDGSILSSVDALGNGTYWTYDAEGRVATQRNSLYETTSYTYDVDGRTTSVTDPRSNITYYQYDGLGNLLERSSPDTATTINQYNASRELTASLAASGVNTTYGYDVLGRLLTISPIGRSYTYDSCTNGVGRLCGVSEPNVSRLYTYTVNGDIASDSVTVSGSTYVTAYSYDSRRRLAAITYSNGNQVIYNYDLNNQISSVQVVIGGVTSTIANTFAYKPFGPRSGYTFGNAVAWAATYDTDYRLSQVATSYNTQNVSITYDAANRLKKLTNAYLPSLTQTFSYDAATRLTGVVASTWSQSWAFDGNGNRTAASVGGLSATSLLASYNNQLLSNSGGRTDGYGYDDVGNITSRTGDSPATFVYDSRNRLVGYNNTAGSTTYLYDGLNLRARKSGPQGSYNYVYSSNGLLLAESTMNSGAISTNYVWLDGTPIAMIRNGAIYYISNDYLGRAESISNQSRTMVWRAYNYSYDRSIGLNSFGGFNMWNPGQYQDAESGLYYNWNRHYDASIGRYLQSDPIGLSGGNNTYTYAMANPVSLVDPFGTDVWVGGPWPHQNINVGTPGNVRGSYTFGTQSWFPFTFSHLLTGGVYRDFRTSEVLPDHQLYMETTAAQDDAAIDILEGTVGSQGPYRALNQNCRTYSQGMFDLLQKTFNGPSQ